MSSSPRRSRIVLIHWNEAEAQQRAAPLRKAGHEVACLFDGKDPAGNAKAMLAEVATARSG